MMVKAALSQLSPEARCVGAQKVAWSYYNENDDQNARRLSLACTAGGGAWATQGAWVQGLASWRLRDYPTALAAFDRVAKEAPDSEQRAAAHYWASRAAGAAGQDRKSVVEGKGVSGRVDLGGWRIIKKKTVEKLHRI